MSGISTSLIHFSTFFFTRTHIFQEHSKLLRLIQNMLAGPDAKKNLHNISEDIITEIYGQTFNSPENVLQFSKVAILAPKNDHCRRFNDKVLETIPGKGRTYTSVNRLISEKDSQVLHFPVEFLDRFAST